VIKPKQSAPAKQIEDDFDDDEVITVAENPIDTIKDWQATKAIGGGSYSNSYTHHALSPGPSNSTAQPITAEKKKMTRYNSPKADI
jgi:hypothetical protein